MGKGPEAPRETNMGKAEHQSGSGWVLGLLGTESQVKVCAVCLPFKETLPCLMSSPQVWRKFPGLPKEESSLTPN